MPIYAYRCESCGHAKDVLQKMSDPLLTVCPACGEPAFKKQVTAAGFQLKGSGWYVTDFRGDGKGAKAPEKDGQGDAAAPGGADAAKAPPAEGSPTPAPAAAAAPAAAPASSPAPAAAPAAAPSSSKPGSGSQ